ncbi:glycosyltransferase [Syntrophothermus lipocalidus]|uniref:Glycosyl transferase group 1 n=1 Tax=Syntrophothermus lipocalidus (strain DSM 12680 / TGB-C1) TaxID=643648 RepID=D7CJ78_SYNLT|nr:glycosyltransferase [Syntrophothermus lipocalidus]ADI00967.1 glycosyl transferase group 1 [Syntrophothermus lipocalidus DSM 12680]
MELFFVTNFSEEQTYWKIVSECTVKPAGSASQVFEGLFLKGFSMLDNVNVTACSFRLIPSFPAHKRIFWPSYSERLFGNTLCIYLPVVNLPVVKQLIQSIGLGFEIIRWAVFNRRKRKAIIFACINVPMVFSALILRPIIGTPVFVIVPDLPSLILTYTKQSCLKRVLSYPFKWLCNMAESRFDGYILLTKYMNGVINRKNRPSIVIEGMSDPELTDVQDDKICMESDNVIMYAGALYRQFGIDKLISAFRKLRQENIQLWIFGTGDMEDEIRQQALIDLRIKFFGMYPRKEVVEFEKKASLLINPRPSDSAFTLYSFPSKTLEYMATGTPVLTTRLPGIPEEYFDYVYVIENETDDGIAEAIQRVLMLPQHERNIRGQRARQFVLENKNCYVQAKKVIEMIEACMGERVYE